MQQIEQEAARKEEINQMKFRFFTNISHELRTPLTLIIAPLEELLKKTAEDESQRNVLQLMYRNAQRLLMLVNQLLDFRKYPVFFLFGGGCVFDGFRCRQDREGGDEPAFQCL